MSFWTKFDQSAIQKAINNYLATGNSLADSEAISRYAATLSKSSKAFLKSAIRLWTERVALQAKSQSTPETVNAVTATLHRLDAINESIRVEQSKAQKAHTWLTQTEVKQLLNHCDDTITGKRDRVVLSLLVGAGLRRSELAALTFDSIKMQGNGNASFNRLVVFSVLLSTFSGQDQD